VFIFFLFLFWFLTEQIDASFWSAPAERSGDGALNFRGAAGSGGGRNFAIEAPQSKSQSGVALSFATALHRLAPSRKADG